MAKKSKFGANGPSQRMLRVGELIRRTLAEVLARGDLHDPDLNRMSITVSEVRVSPDLKIATAFVLPLGGGDAEASLALLAKNKGELRHLITKQMALKNSPDLRFILDDTFDRIEATNRLFAMDAVKRDVDADTDDEEE